MKKKIKVVFALTIFAFMLGGCNLQPNEKEEIMNFLVAIANEVTLPERVSTDINLEQFTFDDNISVTWHSDCPESIDDQGHVIIQSSEVKVTFTLKMVKKNYEHTKDFIITVESRNNVNKAMMMARLEQFTMPTKISDNIVLPSEYNEVNISWNSSNPNILNNDGIVFRTADDQVVSILATFAYNDFFMDKTYTITVQGYTDDEKLQIVMDNIIFPDTIKQDIYLPLNYEFDIVAEYSSSHPNVLDNNGVVQFQYDEQKVKLTITLRLGEKELMKEFDITIASINDIDDFTMPSRAHQMFFPATNFEPNRFNNLKMINKKIILDENQLEGFYESSSITTMAFTSMVASWSAVTSINATVELLVRANINGTWSEYVSYQKWGLGRNNAGQNVTNPLIKLDQDEVIILNSKKCTEISFKVILRRENALTSSPSLSLVSFALYNAEYSYTPTQNVPNQVFYDVPKLYQGAVPTIGNSICSPTSITMLLKYKGLNFTANDSEYEHRYIAGLAKDYGNNIYGNWTYNVAVMGSYGFDTYVARMYSIAELKEYLAYVGPLAISVRGQMTSNVKDYYTAGHLLVAVGYKYVNDQLIIICNDPNVSSVLCEYPESVLKNTWRGVSYVIL